MAHTVMSVVGKGFRCGRWGIFLRRPERSGHIGRRGERLCLETLELGEISNRSYESESEVEGEGEVGDEVEAAGLCERGNICRTLSTHLSDLLEYCDIM
jgi:hypothetical protein